MTAIWRASPDISGRRLVYNLAICRAFSRPPDSYLIFIMQRRSIMAQLWGGRFTKETDKLVYNFNASISFDKKFYRQDMEGSMAHVKMLAAAGILTEEERDDILRGIEGILSDVESGALDIS